jgi:hypothetical protein
MTDDGHQVMAKAHIAQGSPNQARSGRILRLGFNEVAQFLSKSEISVVLSVFSSPYFFHQ